MKVKGFLKDVGGASRVTRARLAAFESASATPEKTDPIGEASKAGHPGRLELKVAQIRTCTKTSKTVRFVRADGGELPYFYAGQFIALEFPMGETIISRPYSRRIRREGKRALRRSPCAVPRATASSATTSMIL